MSSDKIYKPIKESRGWYFVEYHTPVVDCKFATLNLVIINKADITDIVNAMEKELYDWVNHYPIPLFVTAFDEKGDCYDLSAIKSCNHLMGYIDQDGKINLSWRLLSHNEIPDIALNREYVDNLYTNLDFKTYTDLEVDRRKRRQKLKIGWYIFSAWSVITILIALVIAFLDYFSAFVSLIALIYSIYKAIQKFLELTGRWPKSKKTKEKEYEEQLKDHYYYHCQMNPEGFNRLKLENFEKIARNNIKKEAESIKAEDERKCNHDL